MNFPSQFRKFKDMHSFCFFLLCLKCVAFLSVLFFTNLVSAAQVTLAWDANTESDLAGYKIYYKTGSPGEPYNGTGADQGPAPIIVPLYEFSDPDNPEYRLTGLSDEEVYYFVVTAYDNEDPENESSFSNWVSNCINKLAVDFGAYGLWNYDGSAWTSLASWDPEGIEAWDSGLAVDFGTYGVWNYDGSGWTSLAGWDPEGMEACDTGLAVDFGAYGVWNYDGSGWTSLASWDPEGMKAWDSGLAVDFGTDGLWNYDGSGWTSLASWDPEGMKAWDSGLAVDFGTDGLWNYDGSDWTSLAGWDPAGMEAWRTGLAVAFNGSGLWSYDGSAWSFLTSWYAEDMIGVDFF
jgi:hypothetical protein